MKQPRIACDCLSACISFWFCVAVDGDFCLETRIIRALYIYFTLFGMPPHTLRERKKGMRNWAPRFFHTMKINLNLMHGIYNDLMDLMLKKRTVTSVTRNAI